MDPSQDIAAFANGNFHLCHFVHRGGLHRLCYEVDGLDEQLASCRDPGLHPRKAATFLGSFRRPVALP